ncbi:MAG: hypothetical protein E6J15_01850 [Chloroflexi bacterium]|nr:MAG: hypothetical protein E6J15_01850 [Chloroflexota bacterium]
MALLRAALAEHFAGKAPELRTVFRRFVSAARENGPLTVYAQKTRIVLQVRSNPTRTDWIHYFRLSHMDEVDDEVRVWLVEPYTYDSQARLRAGP